MAQRRMISMHIIDTDVFMDMPHSTQCLYMHLLIRADDDGFIASGKKIMRMVGSNDDDLRILIAKKFVIPFESGVCVIKHWRIHNLIRGDRYNPTKWEEEKAKLEIKDNGAYTMATNGIPNGNQMEPQVSIGKVRLGKVSTDIAVATATYGEAKNVKLTNEDHTKLGERLGLETRDDLIEQLSVYMESKGKRYKNHYFTLLAWARKKKDNPGRKTVSFIG